MALPTVFQPVRPQDFTITPITVHKRYVVDSSSFAVSSSGYKSVNAIYSPNKIQLGTSRVYPTNSIDGSYKHILWHFINNRYYKFPYDSQATFEHSNRRYTYKYLNVSASVLIFPQHDFGEGIYPTSVKIRNTNLGITVQDDGNGNLYDIAVSSASFTGTNNLVFQSKIENLYKSCNSDFFVDDLGSYAGTIPTGYYECFSVTDADSKIFLKGCNVNTYYEPTLIVEKDSNAYGLIEHAPYFNFDGDFAVSVKISNQFGALYPTQSILNKDSVIRKQTKDFYTAPNSNGQIVNKYIETSSLFNESINVYPYRIQMEGLIPVAKRSNGINTITLDSGIELDDGSDKLITLVKTGSALQLWVGSNMYVTATDNLGFCGNQHSIIIGNDNLESTASSGIRYKTIRLYDRALTSDEISSLSDNHHQTGIVGNVFYKSGIIVLGSLNLNNDYTNTFVKSHTATSKWSVEYRNTHTIYQWEAIVRIPKGSFNLSQNPTALQNSYTDLLKNEFTGSNPNSDLYPYATTIGLYDDSKELMAVAKLSQPLKMRDDVDINIVCRWDT